MLQTMRKYCRKCGSISVFEKDQQGFVDGFNLPQLPSHGWIQSCSGDQSGGITSVERRRFSSKILQGQIGRGLPYTIQTLSDFRAHAGCYPLRSSSDKMTWGQLQMEM
ncbi:hypothetical protein AOLI_G00198400 [Acnodon oligacanthus]